MGGAPLLSKFSYVPFLHNQSCVALGLSCVHAGSDTVCAQISCTSLSMISSIHMSLLVLRDLSAPSTNSNGRTAHTLTTTGMARGRTTAIK